ncbi:hypothetical protein AAFF_G00432170 [Aldrovandia affinis]|uniref:Uncharacterized protein n=1 Tax=Aldrovandia affinis TaxID=143900 RepID=A0AAD7R376_9TELE|nr:hypothetical protein AAFF_G00432170 [Aldrovandia affinis]
MYLTVHLEGKCLKAGTVVTPYWAFHTLCQYRAQGGGEVWLAGEHLQNLLQSTSPNWYKMHFDCCGDPATGLVSVDAFPWLLFEYRAHAVAVEVVCSGGKHRPSARTNRAINLGVAAYDLAMSLFFTEVTRGSATYPKAGALERYKTSCPRTVHQHVPHSDTLVTVADLIGDSVSVAVSGDLHSLLLDNLPMYHEGKRPVAVATSSALTDAFFPRNETRDRRRQMAEGNA